MEYAAWDAEAGTELVQLLTCTVKTVILKMMGRKYRACTSKREPRAAAKVLKLRHATLDTADRLQQEHVTMVFTPLFYI